MRHSIPDTTNQTRAKALLNDIENAPSTALPRRDTIVEWLNGYLIRARAKDYSLDGPDGNDLIALDEFLRANAVPIASESAA